MHYSCTSFIHNRYNIILISIVLVLKLIGISGSIPMSQKIVFQWWNSPSQYSFIRTTNYIVHSLPYPFPSNCHLLYPYFASIIAALFVFPAPIPSLQQYIQKVSTLFPTSPTIFSSCNFSTVLFLFEFLYLKFSTLAEFSRVFLRSLLKDRWVYSHSLDDLVSNYHLYILVWVILGIFTLDFNSQSKVQNLVLTKILATFFL